MNWGLTLLTIAISICILILLVLWSKIKISASFHVNLSVCIFSFQVKALFGIVRIQRNFDIKKWVIHQIENEEKTMDIIKGVYEKAENQDDYKWLKDCMPLFEKGIKRLYIHSFVWRTGIGTGSAAGTGRIGGLIWSLKGIAETWIKRHIPFKKEPEFSFVPFFQNAGLESIVSCMVSIRTGNAILTVAQIYSKWKKLNNRRMGKDGASNQRVNDDGDGKLKGNDRREYDRRRSG